MEDLSSLEGRVRRCVRYKSGKGGRRVCAHYSAGPGRPRGRRKAGITRKFYERSTTRKRARGIRVCRKVPGKSRKVCYIRHLRGSGSTYTVRRRSRRAASATSRRRRTTTARRRRTVVRASRRTRKRVTTRRRPKSANVLYRQGQAAIIRGQKMISRANKKAGTSSGPFSGLGGRRRSRRRRRR